MPDPTDPNVYPEEQPEVLSKTTEVEAVATALAPTTAPQDLTAVDQHELDVLYATLKSDAILAYINYFLARTPAHLQNAMKALVSDDVEVIPVPAPPPPAPAPAPPAQPAG